MDIQASIALAADYRNQDHGDNIDYSTGWVMVYGSTVEGWSLNEPRPTSWKPGTVAINAQNIAMIAKGGNDYDGAECWESEPVALVTPNTHDTEALSSPVSDHPVPYRIPAALADQTTRLIHPGQSLKEPQGHQEEITMQFEMPVLLTGATRYDIEGKIFVSLQVLNSDPTNKALKGLQPAKMPAEETVFDRLPSEESAYPYECRLIVLNKVSGGKVTQRCIGIMSEEKTATAPNANQPAKKAG